MSAPFAIGLALGSAVIVFGLDTALGRRIIVGLHVHVALLRERLRRR